MSLKKAWRLIFKNTGQNDNCNGSIKELTTRTLFNFFKLIEMKNLKFLTTSILLIAILFSTNTNIFAQFGCGNWNWQNNRQLNEQWNGHWNEYSFNNIPNLTRDQLNKIDELNTEYWNEEESNRRRLNAKNIHLQSMRLTNNPDRSAIYKVIEEIGIIQINMLKNQEQYLQNMRNLFTADQIAYFDELNGRRRNRRGFGWETGFYRRCR